MKKVVFFFLVLLSFIRVTGQILYTNIVPNHVFYPTVPDTTYVFNVDINQDGIEDFTFVMSTWWESGTPSCCMSGCCIARAICIAPLDTNSRVGCVDTNYTSGPCMRVEVDSGYVIDSSSLIWTDIGWFQYVVLPWGLNCTQGGDTMCFGVQLKLNNQVHYGWIRSCCYDYLIDMAIELTPGRPIIAGGLLSVGLNDPLSYANVDLFPNPVTDKLNIINPTNQQIFLRLIDTTGRLVWKDSYDRSQIIPTSGLAPGLYFYQISSRGRVLKQGRLIKE